MSVMLNLVFGATVPARPVTVTKFPIELKTRLEVLKIPSRDISKYTSPFYKENNKTLQLYIYGRNKPGPINGQKVAILYQFLKGHNSVNCKDTH